MKTEKGPFPRSILITVLYLTLISCVPPSFTDPELPELEYDSVEFWACEVVDTEPGAGQHANSSGYGMYAANLSRLIGPPSGNGSSVPDNTSIVSLHGPGASVTVRFSPPILNHPENMGGFDFIIFGNAVWPSNPTAEGARFWQEPAYVEVMKDADGDGKPGTHPDEKWFLIRNGILTPDGASFPLVKTRLESSGTDASLYPGNDGADTGIGTSNWFPSSALYPGIGDTLLHTYYGIPALYAGSVTAPFRVTGFAELTPTLLRGDMSGIDGDGDNSLDDPEDNPNLPPEYFYTVPDTPGDTSVDPGSGGGDAFDISQAIDPETGLGANLDRIDFIRITNPVRAIIPGVLDIDPEIDAVARVRRNR